MKKKMLMLLAIGLVLFSASYFAFVPYYDAARNPYVSELVQKQDSRGLIDNYFISDPDLSTCKFIGSPDAPMTIVTYLSFSSGSSKEFIDNLYPDIEAEFISTGKARICFKAYLPLEDYTGRKNNFIYRNALACLDKMHESNDISHIESLYELGADPAALSERFNLSSDKLNTCIDKGSDPVLKSEMAETEKLTIGSALPTIYVGIGGKTNSVLFGSPSYTRLRRVIRTKDIMLGGA